MPSTSQRIYAFMDFGTTEWERNLDEFDKYVMNYIPIHFIRLSNMKFAERNDVRKHFRVSVSRQKCDRHPASHVKYAVLSHRWLDEGEPTYRDMKSGTAKGRGYQKLKNFCEKARAYGMEFAWSDTCCIDSTNSTEVDESIRSMYRWYFNSDICIIHLAQSETIEDILYDEWTKRGWTLQELLAPVNIKKTEVMTILSLATGIPHGDLWVFRPGQVRVDERMAWAARRETTRVEDVAYSLIGIFDVNLQTSYGEGGERAFCRLIEAIMQGGDPSVLNWTGEPLLYKSSRAFPRSPKNFVGQTLRLPPIHERLEMTTTGRGLRLPLVILPLTSGDAPQAGWVTFQLWKTVESEIYSRAADYLEHRSYQFALGIVNYTIGSSRKACWPWGLIHPNYLVWA
ncbi:hypothetical protein M405DRAFT_935811 [Rhizopogon salebrosus TDB-379]|nr:hypothetical protein M405DRAFT_935811 [Rhizopogon salebrosus TDB-379]